jgi:uncharacterized membrane-anchored protein YhcB (DUF1043 family)
MVFYVSRAWLFILCWVCTPLLGANPQFSDAQQDYISKALPSDNGLDEDVWRKEIASRDYSEGALPDTPEYDFEGPQMDSLEWLKYPLIAIFIGLLIYLIVRFAHTRNLKLAKEFNSDISMLDGQPEDLDLWELPEMLEQALGQQDFRLAVRIRFLILLKGLQERGWLRYAKDKTNRTYVRELHPRKEADPFSKLTRAYEYAWYGGLEVSHADFERFESQSSQIDASKEVQL